MHIRLFPSGKKPNKRKQAIEFIDSTYNEVDERESEKAAEEILDRENKKSEGDALSPISIEESKQRVLDEYSTSELDPEIADSIKAAEERMAGGSPQKSISLFPLDKQRIDSVSSRSREINDYTPPRFDLLDSDSQERNDEEERRLKETASRIQETLRAFGISVTITDIQNGPVFTRYELRPDRNVKVSSIVNLLDDIQLRTAAKELRIQAPIPGKSTIGIDIRNETEKILHLHELLTSIEFRRFSGRLPIAIGKDIGGKNIIYDVAKMPHLLISGTTGSGVSVFIHTAILSLLYRCTPDNVRFLLIDTKAVELNSYKRIPHLIIPVITDAGKASAALNWAVAEMEKRYRLFAAVGVRDIDGYNSYVLCTNKILDMDQKDSLPRIVIIIDELADLMMVSKNEVENAICRLAQLARASGIHLIVATQRPSVNILTGVIKANMPSRIAFAVTSQVDSRIILDVTGAEKLTGNGDMLFFPQDYSKPVHIQGPFVSDHEVTAVTDHLRRHNADFGREDVYRQKHNTEHRGSQSDFCRIIIQHQGHEGRDEYFEEAGRFIIAKNKASVGLIQRVFKIGFNHAARIMDQLAEAGVVSEEIGTRARQVLMTLSEFEKYLEEN